MFLSQDPESHPYPLVNMSIQQNLFLVVEKPLPPHSIIVTEGEVISATYYSTPNRTLKNPTVDLYFYKP